MFHHMCRSIETDLMGMIEGLPIFRCHIRSDLPGRLLTGQSRNWIAIASFGGPIRDHLVVSYGQHNPIILDERFFPEPFDQAWLELVIVHELAHFLAQDINPNAPAHGLLWARCFSALGWLFCLDQIEMHEAFQQILCGSSSQFRAQLKGDNCQNYHGWIDIFSSQQKALFERLEMRHSDKLTYQDLLQICTQV